MTVALLMAACGSNRPDVPDRPLAIRGQVAAPSGLDLISAAQDRAAVLLGDSAASTFACHVSTLTASVKKEALELHFVTGDGGKVGFDCGPVSGAPSGRPFVVFWAPAGTGSVDVDQLSKAQDRSVPTSNETYTVWPPIETDGA